MKIRMLATGLTVVVLLTSCGGSSVGTESVPRLQQSAVTLTAPPTLNAFTRVNEWTIQAQSDTDEIWLSHAVEGEETITVDGDFVLFADVWVEDGEPYLIVGHINSSEEYTVSRYEDSDANGSPDESGETTLFDSGTAKLYVTDIVRTDDGSMYLLDRRCQDILVAIDSDSDGWADTLNMTAFAMSVSTPWLDDAKYLSSLDDHKIRVHHSLPHVGTMLAALVGRDSAIFEDTDADGVADLDTIESARYPHPNFTIHPYDGQTSMDVLALIGGTGRDAEVWKLDSNGDDVAKLGEVTLTGNGVGTVTLSPALSEGDAIGIRFEGATDLQALRLVIADWPQMVAADPFRLVDGTSQAVTILGANFTAAMTLNLEDVDGGLTTPTFTLVSSKEIQLTIPGQTLSGSESSHATVWATASGQPEDRISPVAIRVCPDE